MTPVTLAHGRTGGAVEVPDDALVITPLDAAPAPAVRAGPRRAVAAGR